MNGKRDCEKAAEISLPYLDAGGGLGAEALRELGRDSSHRGCWAIARALLGAAGDQEDFCLSFCCKAIFEHVSQRIVQFIARALALCFGLDIPPMRVDSVRASGDWSVAAQSALRGTF